MSDIKMSDLLALPVVRTAGGVMPFLKDGNGEVMFVGDGHHIDAVVQAVNAHDAMQARIVELEDKNKSLKDWLDNIITASYEPESTKQTLELKARKAIKENSK